MEEVHEGLLGAQASGPLLARKIMKASYYWLTMEIYYIKHVKICHNCQVYQNRKNVPLQLQHFSNTMTFFSLGGEWMSSDL